MRNTKFIIILRISVMIACISKVSGEGIDCYQCTVAPLRRSKDETSQICSKFEENHHFHVNCPKSTMCMKRTIYHKLVNGSIVQTSVERGCAPQLNVFQDYDDDERTWKKIEKVVQTAYRPGCFIGEDRGSPGGPAEYCFCEYPLCNGSQSLNHVYYKINIIIPCILIIFLNMHL